MKIGDIATTKVISVAKRDTVRSAAVRMAEAGVGSTIVLENGALAGILTERDVLYAAARSVDLDQAAVQEMMTAEVITVRPDWEVYEAAAEMAARRIRHLVVSQDDEVLGVVSVRDVLLAGQRVQLGDGHWAVLRDPLTFTVRERRKLQRYLLEIRGADESDVELVQLLALLLGSWSYDTELPPKQDTLSSLAPQDYAALREALLAELPELQRAVHPSPGWRER